MTKISSKTAYPKKTPIVNDYFVGTDSENFGKTVNFGFEETASLINKLNGTPIINYVFSTSPYLSTEVLLEGRFLSEENELSTPSLTKLYINKFNNSGDNLQELYLFLQTNATDFYLKLRNSNNQNNAVYFNISSIEDFSDYFILNITVFKENEFLPLLQNLNIYFFDFELKATSAGTSDPLKLDKDGYTGTAKEIDDRILVLENLQDLNTNFTGQAFAVWTGEGYVYDVIYPDYYIQGVLYPGATQQITLEASDAVYSRFDVIYVNASGAQKATGDPALNPLMPTIDEGIDLFVTSELVVALSTAPVDSSIEQVYNENIEWTTSSLGSLVNFNATNRPSKGIKNADIVNAPTAMFTQFTTPTTKNISDFNTLKFDLFFVENYGKTHGINVYFLNGSTIIGSYVIKSGLNNYKFGNFGAYQSIVVDFSSFTFTGVSFDTIKIVFPWANAGFSIDNVVLVKGSSVISPTQKAITTIVTDSGVANATISDDTFTLKGGNGASVSAVGKVITITPASEVVNTITNGDTTHSPSGDVVFDALALKANLLDAIPLTGTTVGNPVSGVIEVIEGVDFVTNGDGGNNINRIRFSEGDVRLSSEILGTGDTTLIVGAAKINIISSFSGSAGLGSNQNFSPNITDLDYPQKIYVDTGLSSKLDASAYNEHFKGKYTSSGALTTAYPTATDGDYAIVDAGTGVDAKEWIWDNEAGWIVGGATGASTTDALPEGSTNLYWTVARFLANLTAANIKAALGYTPENVANKSDSYTVSSSTTYASTKALVDGLATKQNTLTNPITGTGTTNTIPKFTASGTVGNSNITDNGSLVSVNSLSEFKGTTASDGGQLGTELTTTASGTNWTGTGFATGYTHTTGSVVPLTSTLAAVTNNLYQITYTITGRTTGSVTINYGGIAISGITSSGNSGPKTTSTATLNIVPTTDFNGTVVLSIKAISASVATTTFKNSSGAVTNEIRAHSSNSNFSIGLNAGRSITTGNYNSAIGQNALLNNTTGGNNSAIGQNALLNNTTGGNNSAIGQSALQSNTTGSGNSAIGQSALQSNTTGSNNIAIGQNALPNNTSGNSNSAFGWASLLNNTTGGNNSAIGDSAGRYIANKSTPATILNNSIMLGYRTSPLADNQTNQVVIGYDATGLGSNSTVIGNSSTTTARVYGRQLVNTSTDNGTDQLQVNGSTKTTALTLATAPTTSAGTYDILTRNTSTGVVEKVLSSSVVGGSGTTNYLPKFTGANSLGNSLIYDNGTNVGIGTTNPNQKFVVSNTGANGIEIVIDDIPSVGCIIHSYDRASFVYRPLEYSSSKHFFNNGNVLIATGTDNGVDKLQVNGTISAIAGTTANQVVVKSQLDGKVSLTGNETVAGNKTLSGTTTLNETIIREGYQLKFPKGVMYQSSVGTNALTDNRTVSFPDASGTVALVETVRPYKVYTALLSQSGTSAPTATVLENTLGGTIVWTRVNPGIYSGTLTGAFTTDKTILLNNNPVGGVFTNIFSSVNTITIQTRNYSNAQTDDGLSNTSIEIRVYN